MKQNTHLHMTFFIYYAECELFDSVMRSYVLKMGQNFHRRQTRTQEKATQNKEDPIVDHSVNDDDDKRNSQNKE